jgi:membrane associated rhomboid family serine protease
MVFSKNRAKRLGAGGTRLISVSQEITGAQAHCDFSSAPYHDGMSAVFRTGEEEPLFHLGEFPVRLITLLVALHSGAMVTATLLLASGHGALLDSLAYSSAAVAHGQVWRLVTYAFVAGPSVWFLFEMVMLYYFGKEVENGLGWKRFAILYTGLILLGPLLLQAFGYAGISQTLTGAQEVNFAVFAAFVAMHPGAQFFFGMAARWVFVGLLAISSLQLLADHQPPRVLVLISSCVLAVHLMRRAGFEEPMFGLAFRWSLPGLGKRTPRFSAMSGGIVAAARAKGKADASEGKNSKRPSVPFVDPEVEMDRLLEKISHHGINSLSEAERSSLEQARQAILQRSGGSSS